MENKKTKIAIVIVTILIITLIVVAYFYYNTHTRQLDLLTQEANKILEANLIEDSIDFEIKTEKGYAEVEEAIKEYISKLQNIYVEMEEMVSGINPNSIFSAQNMPDKNLDEIDNIINEFKEKSQNIIEEYQELVTEEKILENIHNKNINVRNDYYKELYKEVMLSDTMKKQYNDLEEDIKNQKGRLYEKLNKIEKIKLFLEENEKSWTIKEDKIQFNNLNRMTEYYGLLNQIID